MSLGSHSHSPCGSDPIGPTAAAFRRQRRHRAGLVSSEDGGRLLIGARCLALRATAHLGVRDRDVRDSLGAAQRSLPRARCAVHRRPLPRPPDQGRSRFGVRNGAASPGRHGADVARGSQVLVQMWQGVAKSRCRCGRDKPQSRCRCGPGRARVPVQMGQAAQPRAGRCLRRGRMVWAILRLRWPTAAATEPHLRLPHADAQAADVPQPGLRRGERLDQPCGLVAPLPLLHVHHLRAPSRRRGRCGPSHARMGEAPLDELAWTAPAARSLRTSRCGPQSRKCGPMGRQGRGEYSRAPAAGARA